MPFDILRQLDDYINSQSLTTLAATYLRSASHSPARDVGTSPYRCVVVEYASHKMGTSVALESRTGEYAYAITLEYDPAVIAYFEQPPAIDCIRVNRSGRRGARLYHPDMLVLRCDGPIVIEVKPREYLDRKIRECPEDWLLEGQRVRDRPAESAFAALGLPHQIVCVDDLIQVRIKNLELLLRTRRATAPVDSKLTSAIERALKRTSVLSLAELAFKIGSTDLTPILALIDQGVLHTKLDSMRLSQPDSCYVSFQEDLLDSFAASDRGARAYTETRTAELVDVPPLAQAKTGLKILERVESGEKGPSISRYRRAIARAEAEGKSALYAVTPKTFRSGNRQRKRPQEVIAFAEEQIRLHWATPLRLYPSAFYRLYASDAEVAHPSLKPLSRPTIDRLIALAEQETAMGRGGLREANALESPTEVPHRALKADRPFELGTCDHYHVDIFLVVGGSQNVTYILQPWLSVLRDCATGDVLAFWLSFNAPSTVACAMLVRACLRAHGRLPEAIIVDHGSDFQSVYFGSLLAHCCVTLVTRPTAHPRYGSEAERLFGHFRSHWLIYRPGNTVQKKESRSVSGSHSAPRHAQLTLIDLYGEFIQFTEWFREQSSRRGLVSCGMAARQGLERFPQSGCKLPYDETFVIATAIEDAKASVDRSRGIKVGPTWYWAPQLAQPNLHGTSLEVRKDPESWTLVYARVGNRWISCQSSGHPSAITADPLRRLCDSIFELTGKEARQLAIEAADRSLIERIRQADDLHHRQTEVSTSCSEHRGNDDPFDELFHAEQLPLDTSQWRDR